jgi:hypothetical protein
MVKSCAFFDVGTELLLLLLLLLVLVLVLFLLFSQVFPGTFPLEPMVNPTTQASRF